MCKLADDLNDRLQISPKKDDGYDRSKRKDGHFENARTATI